jgi:hypothetical protein
MNYIEFAIVCQTKFGRPGLLRKGQLSKTKTARCPQVILHAGITMVCEQ